jgi:hypothetical protein
MEEERVELEQQEREALLINAEKDRASTHPKTDEWRRKMQEKYGIGSDEK